MLFFLASPEVFTKQIMSRDKKESLVNIRKLKQPLLSWSDHKQINGEIKELQKYTNSLKLKLLLSDKWVHKKFIDFNENEITAYQNLYKKQHYLEEIYSNKYLHYEK